MFGWIIDFFRWLTGFWNALPDSIKEKIIDIIIDGFERFFRAFYKNQKGELSV
jgi:hypothetical protein